jgi:squid-like protein
VVLTESHFIFPQAEDRKLFIGGLSWETREPQLKEYFEKFGTVESVNLKMNPMTGKSRCFAFVVFKSAEDVVSLFFF